MRIAMMGTGGVGGYLGGRLAQAGLDVTFVARGAHLQAIRQDGLKVFSPLGDFSVKPAKATDNPTEVGPVDLILFCVKAYDAASAADLMQPMIGQQTTIIPVLNGIDHIDVLKAVGGEHLLGGTAAIGANIASPGVIRHVRGQWLAFGELGAGVSERCTAIQRALAPSGCEIEAAPNIDFQMWRKLVLIASMGICSVVRGSTAFVRGTPETLALLRQAIAEGIAVARASGIAMGDDMLESILASVPAAPYNPSMLVDLERGNRLEAEVLNGAISRRGRALGVPTPAHDFLYACLKPYVNGRPKAA